MQGMRHPILLVMLQKSSKNDEILNVSWIFYSSQILYLFK
jgi:hypothetical protein